MSKRRFSEIQDWREPHDQKSLSMRIRHLLEAAQESALNRDHELARAQIRAANHLMAELQRGAK